MNQNEKFPMPNQSNQKRKYAIFVSSTQKDLQEERTRVIEAILRLGHIPLAMEYFPATSITSWHLIKQLVDDCDYVVCLVAARYGYVPEGETKSYTEKEYDYALSVGKPLIAFLHNRIEDLPHRKHETTELGKERLENFRDKIMHDSSGRNVAFWTDSTTLITALTASLHDLFDRSPAPGWVRATKPSSGSRNAESPKQQVNATLLGRLTREPKNAEQKAILKEAYTTYQRSESAWLIPSQPDKNVDWLAHHGYLERDANGRGFKLSLDGWDYMEALESQEKMTESATSSVTEPIKNSTNVAPTAEQISDSNDIISAIESWMGSRPADLNTRPIRYDDVDRELNLVSGSARAHLATAAARWGYTVRRPGKDTILFEEPSPSVLVRKNPFDGL